MVGKNKKKSIIFLILVFCIVIGIFIFKIENESQNTNSDLQISNTSIDNNIVIQSSYDENGVLMVNEIDVSDRNYYPKLPE